MGPVEGAARPVVHRLRVIRGLGSLALGLVVIALALPTISGMSWTQLGPVIGQVTPLELLLLAGIWVAGLLVHTVALTAALPSLTHRRALTLSLTGSAVSNVTPLGGAVGVGMNFHMIRTWGFTRTQFVVFTFVTNLWDVLAKLFVPAAILGFLLVTGTPSGLPASTAIGGLSVLVAATAVLGVLVTSERAAIWVAAVVAGVARWLLGVFRSQRTVDPTSLLDLRESSLSTVRAQWLRLSLGQVGYTSLLFVLLWASLHIVGSGLSTPQILAGLAVERLLSLSILTPGGTGVIELGLAGFLVAAGGIPQAVVAGILLYRAFTFLIEIPVGGALLGCWLWVHQPRLRPTRRSDEHRMHNGPRRCDEVEEPAPEPRRLAAAGSTGVN